MTDEARPPEFHAVGRPITLEKILDLFRKLSGRESTEEEVAETEPILGRRRRGEP